MTSPEYLDTLLATIHSRPQNRAILNRTFPDKDEGTAAVPHFIQALVNAEFAGLVDSIEESGTQFYYLTAQGIRYLEAGGSKRLDKPRCSES